MSFLFSRKALQSISKSSSSIFRIRLMGSKTARTENNQLKVVIEKEATGVSDHMASPPKFVPISAQTFYCKDSRGDSANFGAPAGDFGEFLLALNCYFKKGEPEPTKITEIFGKWLDERCTAERPFYLHSDRPAVTRLFKSIGREDLSDPSELKDSKLQERFIELFGSDGQFQGCGHLRLILEESAAYEINGGLLKSLAGAFFGALWRGDDRVQFKIYESVQNGRALAVIYGPKTSKESLLTTQTTADSDQIFILNQHAVSNFRKQFLVPFFKSLNLVKCDETALFKEMEDKGWRNAMFSANSLAGGKPVYRIDLIE